MKGIPSNSRLPRWLGPALLALVSVTAVVVSPAVRMQLRESFVRIPTEYTELSFGADPTLSGAAVRVPVTLVHHGATTESFTVRASVAGQGATSGTSVDKSITGPPGATESAVLIVPVPLTFTAYNVDVALPGHPQTLHFKLTDKDAA